MKKAAVEVSEDGRIIRIFKTLSAAVSSDLPDERIQIVSYRMAISKIRQQVWERTKGNCEWCAKIISDQSMHLHEMIHRGEGGEISLINCVGICYECHFGPAKTAHGNRSLRFGGRR